MRRQVDAEQAQARERDGHGLGVFRLHGMEQDLQVVSGRLIDFRRPALQQLPNQLLGCVEATGQKFALRAFEPQVEGQFAVAAPGRFIQERHASRKIRQR